MMSCQKHPTDPSSSAGVCASCLRERLFVLIAAQTPPHAQPDIQSPAHPPPSVSPKPNPPELSNKNLLLRRFHSTPQARPESTVSAAPAKKQHRKFSVLSHLFRSISGKFSSDCDGDGSISSQADSIRTSSASPSWFSFHRGRRREPTTVSSLEDSGDAIRWKPFWIPDRGMSPLDNCQDGSPSRWRRKRTSASGSAPARRTKPLSHFNNNVQGVGLCMSPLVRASPNRYGKQKRGETGLSGDTRVPSQPHISAPAAASGRGN